MVYTRINAVYPPSKRAGFDLVDLNLYVAIVFTLGWLFVGLTALRFA